MANTLLYEAWLVAELRYLHNCWVRPLLVGVISTGAVDKLLICEARELRCKSALSYSRSDTLVLSHGILP